MTSMLKHKQVLGFIDEPSPFDTLEAWQGHLAGVAEAAASPLKGQLVRTAREMIYRKARLNAIVASWSNDPKN
jgi:hypothetical protein